MHIEYCHECGKRLDAEAFNKGRAIHVGDAAYCASHDVAASVAPASGGRRGSSQPNRKTGTRVSGPQRVVMDTPGASDRRARAAAARGAARRSALPIWIGGATLLVAGVIIALVFIRPGRNDAGNDTGRDTNAGRGPANTDGNAPAPAAVPDPAFIQWSNHLDDCIARLSRYRQHPPESVDERVHGCEVGRQEAQALADSAPSHHERHFELDRLVNEWIELAAEARYAYVLKVTDQRRKGETVIDALIAWTTFERASNGRSAYWPDWARPTRYTAKLTAIAADLKTQWLQRLGNTRDASSPAALRVLDPLRGVIDQSTSLMLIDTPTAIDLPAVSVRSVELGNTLLRGWESLKQVGEGESLAAKMLFGIQDMIGSTLAEAITGCISSAYEPDGGMRRQALRAASEGWMGVWGRIYPLGKRVRWISESLAEFENARPAETLPADLDDADTRACADTLSILIDARRPDHRAVLAGILELVGLRQLRLMTPATDEATTRLMRRAVKRLADVSDAERDPDGVAEWYLPLYHLLAFAADEVMYGTDLNQPERFVSAARVLGSIAGPGASSALEAGQLLACANLRNVINDQAAAGAPTLVEARQLLDQVLLSRRQSVLLTAAEYRQDAIFRSAICFKCVDDPDRDTRSMFANVALQHLEMAASLPDRR